MAAKTRLGLPNHFHEAGEKIGQVEQKTSGDRSNRSALGHDELRPSIHEAHRGSIGAVEIDVFTTGLRKRASHLGIAECPEKAENAREYPHDEHHERGPDVRKHDAGNDEDRRADHGARDNRGGAVESESFDQLAMIRHSLGRDFLRDLYSRLFQKVVLYRSGASRKIGGLKVRVPRNPTEWESLIEYRSPCKRRWRRRRRHMKYL